MIAVTFDTVRQLVASGLVNGAFYGILGVAFALILGVTGRFHYAFGALYTLAAFLTYSFFDRFGLPFILAAILGIGIPTVLGMAMERWVYRPLANRAGQAALLSIFVASLGIGIATTNLIQIVWGAQTHSLLAIELEPINILGANLTNVDLYIVGMALLLLVVLTATFRFTGLGRSIKATRSNPDMALYIGISPSRIYLTVFAIAGAIAGIMAILSATKFAVEPTMGFRPVVLAFVVAFLGGIREQPIRVFVTGLIIGLIETVSSIWLSVRWNQLVVFVILVLYLVWYSMDHSTLTRMKGLLAGRGKGNHAGSS